MKKLGKLVGGLALLLFVVCISSLANAQAPDFSGTWTGKAECPIGSVEFTMEIQGSNGTFTYRGHGPQKLYATKFPVVEVRFQPREMLVFFNGPNPNESFQSFGGKLLADGTVGGVYGLKVNGAYCKEFPLSRDKTGDQSRVSKGAPSFNAKGLANESLLVKLMQGNFAAIDVPTDHAVFNSLYGSYLGSYARQCTANAKTRPKNFVEMTNLQCGDERTTATYYSNGTYTESAPYCARWKDVPNGLYADPKMWEVKKKLDAVFLGDKYKHIFSFLKATKPDIYAGVFEPSPQRIVAAIATGARDMDALVEMNACDSPGLMRFQENLRLYALNRPFGIRSDGSSGAPIPIPASGTTFKDPNYETLLEDLVKGAARSWQTNKYLLGSVANPSVISRDSQGRPLSVKAGYRFGGMAGMQQGSVTVTFFEGYPECLYFFDKPNSCRSPNKDVTARYVHGSYSLQNTSRLTPEEKHLEKEKEAKASEERRKKRRELSHN